MVGPVPVGVNSFEFEVSRATDAPERAALTTASGRRAAAVQDSFERPHRRDRHPPHVLLRRARVRPDRLLRQHRVRRPRAQGPLRRVPRRRCRCERARSARSREARRRARPKRPGREATRHSIQHQMVRKATDFGTLTTDAESTPAPPLFNKGIPRVLYLPLAPSTHQTSICQQYLPRPLTLTRLRSNPTYHRLNCFDEWIGTITCTGHRPNSTPSV